jgi:hypothetical protein
MNLKSALNNFVATTLYIGRSLSPGNILFFKKICGGLAFLDTSLSGFQKTVAGVMSDDDNVTLYIKSENDIKSLPALMEELAASKATITKIKTSMPDGLIEVLKILSEANENRFDSLHEKFAVDEIDISKEVKWIGGLFVERGLGGWKEMSPEEEQDMHDSVDALCGFLTQPGNMVDALKLPYADAFDDQDVNIYKLFYAIEDPNCNVKDILVQALRGEDGVMFKCLKEAIRSGHLSYVREYVHSNKKVAPEQGKAVKKLNKLIKTRDNPEVCSGITPKRYHWSLASIS